MVGVLPPISVITFTSKLMLSASEMSECKRYVRHALCSLLTVASGFAMADNETAEYTQPCIWNLSLRSVLKHHTVKANRGLEG